MVDNSSLASGNHSGANNGSEYEDEIKYDHPELPEEITLRKRYVTKRMDVFEQLTKNSVIQNEKKLRCILFEAGKYGDVEVSFRENTNKEKLILEHIRKYEMQFKIAYKDSQ